MDATPDNQRAEDFNLAALLPPEHEAASVDGDSVDRRPHGGESARRWAVATLLIGGILGTAAAIYLALAIGWSDHAQQVQLSLRTLRSQLREAESGQRGFLLTGDPEYLAPYVRSAPAARRSLDNLLRLTGNDDAQQERLGQLREHLDDKLDELAETVELAKAGDSEAALAIVNSDEGLESAQAAVAVLNELADAEQATLAVRDRRVRISTSVVLAVIPLMSLCALLLDRRATRQRLDSDRERAAHAKARALVQSRFSRLVEQIDKHAIFATDQAGRAEGWGEGVGQVLGYPRERFKGEQIDALLYRDGDLEQGAADADRGGASRKGTAQISRWMRRSDGGEFWAEGAVTALRDLAGHPVGFMYVLRDQTEQKRLEEELRQLSADLSESARRKDEFLATLAHELRNPLAPIRSGLELLREAQGEQNTLESVRGILETQSNQLTRLVDDLLDVSRITRGKLRVHRERIDLRVPLRDAADAVSAAAQAQQHALRIDLPGEPVYADADRHRIAQVVGNLLTNAIKYTRPGGEIGLSLAAVDGKAQIAVRDTGIGLAPEAAGRIFDMFAQVDASRPMDQGGLGIGLTLVRSLAEMHGGSAACHSDGLGEGSVFTVFLPLADVAAGGEEKDGFGGDAPAATADPTEPAAGPLVRSVLIVDDNAPAADLLAALIRRDGYEVRVAYDGREALSAGADCQPDAILMDIGMPVMNGYEAAAEIRRRTWGRDALLLAVTGWGQAEDRQRTAAAGFDGHLVKPVDIDRVRHALRHRTVANAPAAPLAVS